LTAPRRHLLRAGAESVAAAAEAPTADDLRKLRLLVARVMDIPPQSNRIRVREALIYF
jgi:hypothetical protein